MVDIATYKLTKGNVDPWLAFIVLPNGKLWDVRFSGSTEEEAKQKAVALWTSERKIYEIGELAQADPWQSEVDKHHHLTNTIWIIHKETREKKRISLTEITMYEKNGWERGGPRSK